MKQIQIQKQHLEKAELLAKDLGTLRNSITHGQGNLAGFIGEVIVAEILDATHVNTYNFDLLWGDNLSIDVKTKRTNVAPKHYYESSIAAYNTKQQCDFYAFCRVSNDFKTLWFLGMVPKEYYFQNARFLKKGTVDGDNGFVVKADCYNMSIEDIWAEFKRMLSM